MPVPKGLRTRTVPTWSLSSSTRAAKTGLAGGRYGSIVTISASGGYKIRYLPPSAACLIFWAGDTPPEPWGVRHTHRVCCFQQTFHYSPFMRR